MVEMIEMRNGTESELEEVAICIVIFEVRLRAASQTCLGNRASVLCVLLIGQSPSRRFPYSHSHLQPHARRYRDSKLGAVSDTRIIATVVCYPSLAALCGST